MYPSTLPSRQARGRSSSRPSATRRDLPRSVVRYRWGASPGHYVLETAQSSPWRWVGVSRGAGFAFSRRTWELNFSASIGTRPEAVDSTDVHQFWREVGKFWASTRLVLARLRRCLRDLGQFWLVVGLFLAISASISAKWAILADAGANLTNSGESGRSWAGSADPHAQFFRDHSVWSQARLGCPPGTLS